MFNRVDFEIRLDFVERSLSFDLANHVMLWISFM